MIKQPPHYGRVWKCSELRVHRYDEAKEKENSAGMEAARASYRKLSKKLKAVEKATRRISAFMRMPTERGNDIH